jgi:hypothetical protein
VPEFSPAVIAGTLGVTIGGATSPPCLLAREGRVRIPLVSAPLGPGDVARSEGLAATA